MRPTPPEAASGPVRLLDLVRLLRPAQWPKNAVVLAAFLFALGDKNQIVAFAEIVPALVGTALFCVISSGVYIMNDIRDLDADRLHPAKRRRPIAAGKVTIRFATAFATSLLLVGLCGAAYLSLPFAGIAAGYVVLQILYTFWLKRVALLDVLIIALGFILRALGGAVVLRVYISPWLVLCTFLLALFLALCKRRHEKKLLDETANEHRPGLGKYGAQLLDQLILVVSTATVLSYAFYTMWPDTVEKFGSPWIAATIPFVLFGIGRYLFLVYRRNQGDRPEKVLLTDLPLLVTIALYGLTVLAIFAAR